VNGFNLSERNILIINVLFGLVIFAFLGLSATDIFKLRAASDVLPGEAEYARTKPAHITGDSHPKTYYNAIVSRDIFNLAPPPTPAPLESENLDVKLVGVSQVSEGKPWAIIQDDGGKQNLYQVGQSIPGAGKLLEVESSRVILLHNGHRVALDLPRQAPQPGPAMKPPPRPGFLHRMPRRMEGGIDRPNPGIRRLGGNNYQLARTTVDSSLKNMAPLFTQIRATPQIENGVASGYRLTEIQPGSLFQQIGLQDGDLLKSVNGQTVGDPAKAMMMLQSLQSQPSITLNVVRNGTPTTLHYNIH